MSHTDAVKNVLEGLLSTIDRDNQQLASDLGNSDAIKTARDAVKEGDLDAFYFAIAYPMGNLLDGLLAQELCSDEAQFMFRRGEFIESHFRKQIELYEGTACGADKTGAILNSLLRFFTHGNEIKFNYEQQYTYHLPKKIFKSHEAIVAFFYAIRKMYHGQADDYITIVQSLRNEISLFVK